MRFSLIVPTLGRVDPLERLLASVNAQSHRDFDVAVVDQNPDDRLAPLLERYAGQFTLRRFTSDRGARGPRNAGLLHSTGDVVAFPDDDCWYPPDLLERVAARLAAEPGLDGITGRPAGDPYWDAAAGPINPFNVWKRGIEFTLFLRRRLVDRVGILDKALGPGSGTPFWAAEGSDYLLRAPGRTPPRLRPGAGSVPPQLPHGPRGLQGARPQVVPLRDGQGPGAPAAVARVVHGVPVAPPRRRHSPALARRTSRKPASTGPWPAAWSSARCRGRGPDTPPPQYAVGRIRNRVAQVLGTPRTERRAEGRRAKEPRVLDPPETERPVERTERTEPTPRPHHAARPPLSSTLPRRRRGPPRRHREGRPRPGVRHRPVRRARHGRVRGRAGGPRPIPLRVRRRVLRQRRRFPPGGVSDGLKQYLLDRRRDVLVVLDGVFHPSVYAVSHWLRKNGVPYVAAPHDPYHPSIFRKNAHVKWPYWYLRERPMLRAAAAVQVLDGRHGAFLKRLRVRTEVFETPNGFLPAEVPPEQSLRWGGGGVPRLVFMGRLDAFNKGLDLLLEAFARLPVSDATLAVRGPDAGDAARLGHLARSLGVSGRVDFPGPDFTRSGPGILADYDVFCLPSRFEGFGLAALEAMLAGRPLVVSDVAGIAPHVRASGCGVVVEPDVASVVSGIQTVLSRGTSGATWASAAGTTPWNTCGGTASPPPPWSVTPGWRHDVRKKQPRGHAQPHPDRRRDPHDAGRPPRRRPARVGRRGPGVGLPAGRPPRAPLGVDLLPDRRRPGPPVQRPRPPRVRPPRPRPAPRLLRPQPPPRPQLDRAPDPGRPHRRPARPGGGEGPRQRVRRAAPPGRPVRDPGGRPPRHAAGVPRPAAGLQLRAPERLLQLLPQPAGVLLRRRVLAPARIRLPPAARPGAGGDRAGGLLLPPRVGRHGRRHGRGLRPHPARVGAAAVPCAGR